MEAALAICSLLRETMMHDSKDRENELKLDILGSLARSQRALADMLEGVAALTGESPEAADQLRRQVEVLVRCQTVLAEKICGIRISRIVRGRPGKLWLHAKVFRSGKEHHRGFYKKERTGG
jgi:hypothetical protein